MIYSHTFTKKIKLSAESMNKSSKEIDYLLLTKIKDKFGNKCIDQGYILKNKISIINRSKGYIDTIVIDGGICYTIKFTADVCYLDENEELECKIIKKNDEGLLLKTTNSAYKYIPLIIILPIRWHQDQEQEELRNLKINETIQTKVLGSRITNNTDLNIIVVWNK